MERNRSKGFTLIELVVVIVVLGILAATALPRFINITSDARKSAVQGAAGGLRATMGLVQAKWTSAGSAGATTVTMADNTVVTVGTVAPAAGIPVGATGGIDSAMNCESAVACQGMVITVGAVSTWQTTTGGSATCQATYTAATGAVAISTAGC